MNKAAIIEIIRKNKKELKNLGIYQIGLFGSIVRGENKEDSDVDLVIEFNQDEKNFHNYMEACDILERIIKVKVDIVTPEAISLYIKPYIDKEIVYERL